MRSPTSAAILMPTKNASVGSVKINEPPSRKGLLERHHHERLNRVDKRVRNQEPDEKRRDRGDEPFPQLVQMVQKGHPAAGAIAIELVLVSPLLDRVLVVRIGCTGHWQGGHRRLGVRQTVRPVSCCESSAGAAGAGADVAGVGADDAGAVWVCCSAWISSSKEFGSSSGTAGAGADGAGAGAASLFDVNLFLEGVAKIVRRALELTEALAERTAKLGQLPRSKHDQRDHQNDDQFHRPERTKHDRGSFRACRVFAHRPSPDDPVRRAGSKVESSVNGGEIVLRHHAHLTRRIIEATARVGQETGPGRGH